MQDHQRIALLEGKLGGNPEDEDDTADLPETIIPLTHVQEERALRDEVTKAFHTAIGGDEDEDEGFLVKREKTDTERNDEKEAYRQFLLANGGGEEQVRELLGLGDEDDGKDHQSDDGVDAAMQAQADESTTSGGALARKQKTARQKKDDEAFLME